MIIRPINNSDIQSFIKLCDQLGYKIDAEHVSDYIANVLNNNEITLIAEKNGRIAGWINCRINKLIYHQAYLDITGLVVDNDSRGQGIGTKLLFETERWALSKGIKESIMIAACPSLRFIFVRGLIFKSGSSCLTFDITVSRFLPVNSIISLTVNCFSLFVFEFPIF